MSRPRLLILLLVLLCAAVGYAWWATPKQRRVTVGTTFRPTEPQTTRIDVAPEVADLDFPEPGGMNTGNRRRTCLHHCICRDR